MKLRVKLFILLTSLLLSSCSWIPFWNDGPYMIHLELKASDYINPNFNDKSAPVVITVYQLTDNEKFIQADFFQLFEGEAKQLDKDIVQQRKLPALFPGEVRKVDLELHQKAKFLGAVVAFADYQKAKTKDLTPLVVESDNEILLTIDGLNASLMMQSD